MPVGIKIISVLYYIGTALELLFGILLLVGAGTIASKIPFFGAAASGFFSGFFIVLGIILIGLAVLSFFVGRGLWKGQKWARIVAIIFAVIGVLFAVLGMVQGQIVSNVISLVISAVIGGYLWFSSEVKTAFA